MIADLQDASSDPFQDKVFDVCICGAGVAGITLALRLSRNLNVLLLEAGGAEYSEQSQAVYEGSIVGRDYFDLTGTRLRYFGGTSNRWAGWCRPLDPIDFKPKPYAGISGWPIDERDLTPYLDEAKAILDIQSAPDRPEGHSDKHVSKQIPSSGDFESIEFLWSLPPTRFGTKFRPELEAAQNVVCFLNANVVGIRLADNKSTVNHIEVRTYAGKGFRVISRCLVLAAGGIENPRLLLNANKDIDKGIGNDHDNVGRYFAEHPHHTVGEFILEDAVREGLPRRWKRWFHAYEFFSATERLMREDEILNFGLRFKHYRREPRDFEERLKRIVCRSELAEGATEWLLDEDIPCFGHGHIEGALKIASEQAPNAMSRVRLDSQTDQFGNRRIALDWRLSEIDKRTIRIATFKFGEALAKLNLGRLRVADWLMTPDSDLDLPGLGKAELGGNHHLCTTRMASSPRYGVVDENQRVFGTDNLYVAGSSVFSTGGHANPTLTIVQLALRLADHLNCILTRLQPTVACELGSVEQIESTSPRPGVC